MNDKANKCIACSVTQCSNHSCCEDYCTLDKIQVGTHEIDPTKKQCTDCQSFRLKSADRPLECSNGRFFINLRRYFSASQRLTTPPKKRISVQT